MRSRLDNSPIFQGWHVNEIDTYVTENPGVIEDPNKPPRKGVTPGQPYSFSLHKYMAAVASVIIGQQFKPIKLQEVVEQLSWILGEERPTPDTVSVWRSEKRFKELVQNLREKYAAYVASNILEDPPIYLPRPLEVDLKKKGLVRQLAFILESIRYPFELLYEIGREIRGRTGKTGDVLPRVSLAVDAWFILLVNEVKNSGGPKAKKRKLYAAMEKEIFSGMLEDTETDLTKGELENLKRRLKWEFVDILNAGIEKMEKGNSSLSAEEITIAIRFLAGDFVEWN